MSYRGWCRDDDHDVIKFLKQVIGGTYEAGVFVGGCGFQYVWQAGEKRDGLIYHNAIDTSNWGFSFDRMICV